jgi:OTU domain-containing protein 7
MKAYRLMNTKNTPTVNASCNGAAYVRLPNVPRSVSGNTSGASALTRTTIEKVDHRSPTQSIKSAPSPSRTPPPPPPLTTDRTSPTSAPEVNGKRLLRGISRATDNVNLVCKVRHELANELTDDDAYDEIDAIDLPCIDLPKSTFTLPDLSLYSNDFRHFLERDLIEQSTLGSLRGTNRLNWWHDRLDRPIAQPLYPLATTGDGNCLLHAASLAMFGFHDRLLTLRKALHRFMLRHAALDSPLYRRWRFQCSQQHRQAGLVLCDEEWLNDWRCLLKMASSEPRVRGSAPVSSPINAPFADDGRRITFNACCGGQPSTECYAQRADHRWAGGKKKSGSDEQLPMPNHVYESLEEIHVLALAHVLRRPIIVIADTMLKDVTGEPFAPIPFGGIYLPLQCTPSDCTRAPLCLTYDAAHFSALVPMDVESFADRAPQPPVAIPLVDFEGSLLPLQFAIEPGCQVHWTMSDIDSTGRSPTATRRNQINLLRTYLDLVFLDKNGIVAEPPTNGLAETSEPSTLTENRGQTTIDRRQNGRSNTPDPQRHETSSDDTKSLGRVATQLSNISRGFGTLRRSMSKRIKKNLSTFGKRSSAKSLTKDRSKSDDEPIESECTRSADVVDSSDLPPNTVIAAALHVETRPEYHDQMIRNYLSTARQRFLTHQSQQTSNESIGSRCGSAASSASSQSTLVGSTTPTGPTTPDEGQGRSPDKKPVEEGTSFAMPCVNSGCKNFGTGSTNYLCNGCFHNQQKEMLQLKSAESISVQI